MNVRNRHTSPLVGGHPGGQVSYVLAICENEKGMIDCFPPEKLRLKRNPDFYKVYAMGNWGGADQAAEKDGQHKETHPKRQRR